MITGAKVWRKKREWNFGWCEWYQLPQKWAKVFLKWYKQVGLTTVIHKKSVSNQKINQKFDFVKYYLFLCINTLIYYTPIVMNNKGKKVLTDEELQQVSGGVLIDSIVAEVPCNRFKTENDCIARDHCEWSMGGYCEEAIIPIENAH